MTARTTAFSATAHGAAAEALAADYLICRGLTVMARNLRCRMGELDLVCLDGEVIAFVEVRQRAGTGFGGALASVTRRKQHKLIRAARYFGQRDRAWQRRAWRFDVVAVQGDGVEWIKDAFRAGR